MKQETKDFINSLKSATFSDAIDELLKHPEILALEGYVRTNYDQYDTVIVLKKREGEFTKDIKAEKTSDVIALLSTALHIEINDSLQLPTPPKQ